MIKFIIFFIYLYYVFGQTPSFNVGEILTYNASFANIDAANASLEVIEKTKINNQKVYHMRFKAKSKGAINYFFPINDEVNLWLNEETLLPVKVQENIHEGKFKSSRIIDFYQENGYALINNDTIKIDYKTHSPYSLFYFFRKHNIEKFKDEIITLIQKRKTIPLKIKIKEKEDTIVPVGKYLCSKISPTRIDKKKFKNKAELDLFLSYDQNRYPIKKSKPNLFLLSQLTSDKRFKKIF